MAALKFDRFGGQIPLIDERLLPMENAVYTENAFLQSGRLEPLAADIPVHTLANPNARYAFRVPIAATGIENIVDSYWLEFDNDETTVVRSPVSSTAEGGRYYWANANVPPGYTTKTRVETGTQKIPVQAAITTLPTGGTLAADTYYYVVTTLYADGETLRSNEQSITTVGATSSNTISWAAVTGATGYRIYRSTISGLQGAYYSVGAVTSFVDTGAAPSAGVPPMFSTSDQALTLGIPRPAVPPGVSVTGGSTPVVTRGYVYTWVSQYGEEGQPSPPTVFTGNSSGTWDITMTAPTTPDMADRALTYTRIYRTEADANGNAAFFFVAQLPIATLAYADTVSSDIVANSEQLQSEDWSGPPADLLGMVSMPNGMIAGWRKNEIWFCEPYRPHAWPVKYVLNVEFDIVGFGTIDQNLMVLTKGQPYVATGIHPEVMALKKIQPVEPCTSMGSIVAIPGGVLYTSYNGLILIGPSGSKNMTKDMIRKDDWNELFNLATLKASYFMGGYYTYSGAITGVFQDDAFQVEDAFQDENFKGTQQGAHISLDDAHLGYMTLTCDSPTYNVMTDVWTGETLVIRGGKVIHVDRRGHVPRQSYKWQSKIIQTNYVENFAAVRVFYDPPDGPLPYDGTTFRYYANGVLRYTRPIVKSGQQFRLPSGFRCDFVQFELEGQLMIYNMQIATSPHELRQV